MIYEARVTFQGHRVELVGVAAQEAFLPDGDVFLLILTNFIGTDFKLELKNLSKYAFFMKLGKFVAFDL